MTVQPCTSRQEPQTPKSIRPRCITDSAPSAVHLTTRSIYRCMEPSPLKTSQIKRATWRTGSVSFAHTLVTVTSHFVSHNKSPQHHTTSDALAAAATGHKACTTDAILANAVSSGSVVNRRRGDERDIYLPRSSTRKLSQSTAAPYVNFPPF